MRNLILKAVFTFLKVVFTNSIVYINVQNGKYHSIFTNDKICTDTCNPDKKLEIVRSDGNVWV